jgi:hypothetical protein
MNFKDLVQSLLFYVGIPAVTLYPLGFAALAIQLWNDPLFPYYDFDTVAVLPRPSRERRKRDNSASKEDHRGRQGSVGPSSKPSCRAA